MQQLDYWFDKYPEGFYKFLSPCLANKNYKNGDSWCEELGFSKNEFRTAFDQIGVRHGSKSAYCKANNPFLEITSDGQVIEKYYCSYTDKIKGLTFYFRNTNKVNKDLDALMYGTFSGNQEPESPEVKNLNFRKSRTQISVNQEPEFPEVKNLNLDTYTENTTEITTNTPLIPPKKEEGKEFLKGVLEIKHVPFVEDPAIHVKSNSINQANFSALVATVISSEQNIPKRENDSQIVEKYKKTGEYPLKPDSSYLFPWEVKDPVSGWSFDLKFLAYVGSKIANYSNYRKMMPGEFKTETKLYVNKARYDNERRDKIQAFWDDFTQGYDDIPEEIAKMTIEQVQEQCKPKSRAELRAEEKIKQLQQQARN